VTPRLAQRLRRIDRQLVKEPARPLGAKAGQARDRQQAGGKRSRSLTAAGISPVSISARIFSSSVAPMPASSVTRPASASAATEVGASRTTFAALR